MQTQQIETHTRILSQDLDALRKIQGSKSIASTLHAIISNHQPTRALTLIELREDDFVKLNKIKEECGFSDLGYVVHQILQLQQTIEIVSVQKVMKENCCAEEKCTPVCLSGKSCSGKTWWIIHSLLPSLAKENKYNVVVIDTNHEYNMLDSLGNYVLKEIKSIRELELSSNQHQMVRFLPALHSVMGSMMIKSLFIELNMLADNNPQALKNLVLIFEEYRKTLWANEFLYKSRHFGLRKMIVVTPDYLPNIDTFTVFR